MQVPLKVVFHDVAGSESVEAVVREKAGKLEKYFDRIISCRVVVDGSHRHHHQGNLYNVKIHIDVPGEEIVVDHRQHGQHSKHAHEDVYVALRDAFDAARRRLEDYVRRLRRQVKTHESWSHGRVSRLCPDEGAGEFGFITASDGSEVYFHQNSVLNCSFADLEAGCAVEFVLEEGEKGPQASSVKRIDQRETVVG